jgi:regulatory protein
MSLLGLDDLKLKLEHYCAYQERSVFEVEQKLRKFTHNENTISIIKDALFTDNFLNQNRFVDAFIQGKINQKRWGKTKIKAGLIRHQVPLDVIDKKLSSLSVDVYKENLFTLARKKAKTISNDCSDFEKKSKVMRFLYSKGYTAGDWEVIDFNDLFDS